MQQFLVVFGLRREALDQFWIPHLAGIVRLAYTVANSNVIGARVVKYLFTYGRHVRKTSDGTVAIGICAWEQEVGEPAENKKCILILPRMVRRKNGIGNSGSDACQLSYIAAPVQELLVGASQSSLYGHT